MRHILLAFVLIICAATTLPAQFVQGTLQGGPPAPGTKSRSPLNSLERAASNRFGATIMTDSFGNQRFTFYVSVWDTCLTYNPETDPVVGGPISVFVRKCETDSIWYIDYNNDKFFLGVTSGSGGPVENWYTVDDTTTDATRTAYIMQNAYWYGLDPSGNILFSIGDVSVSDFSISASEYYASHSDLGGLNGISINATGIDIFTSNNASRAVDITTDTMNWIGSVDAANFRVNYLSDQTYMYADSNKIVALGQFPNLPNLLYDGTEKGFLYYPGDPLVTLVNGDGSSGDYTYVNLSQNTIYIASTLVDATYSYVDNGVTVGSSSVVINIEEDNNGASTYQEAYADLEESNWIQKINEPAGFVDTFSYFEAYQSTDGLRNIRYTAFGEYDQSRSFASSAYIGKAPSNGTEQHARSVNTAFGVQQVQAGSTYIFDWLKIDLYDTITTKNAIQFYNDRYRFKNAEPSSISADTSFHFWAGNGAGSTVPGFITLDQVCAHCAADAVNWYNSNGATTDNTRIATVTETATWLSSDGDLDGVFPFRFELEDASPNEPEMMVWLFPDGDSLALQKSDTEIQFHTNTDLSSWADGIYSMRADSAYFTSNGAGGTGWKVTDYQVQNNAQRITQTLGSNAKQDVIETVTITGTAQTELTMPTTGSVLNLASNSAGNFEIHITAICSAAGNGVGISTGETYVSWAVGGIKNIGGTTALVGTVQLPATAQADAGMSTSVVTVDANNTNDSLRIRFTPPSTAGTTTVIKVIATIDFTQTAY